MQLRGPTHLNFSMRRIRLLMGKRFPFRSESSRINPYILSSKEDILPIRSAFKALEDGEAALLQKLKKIGSKK